MRAPFLLPGLGACGEGKSHTFTPGANQMRRCDAQWFHLEIYRQECPSLFFCSRLPTLTCSPARLCLKFKRSWKYAISIPLIPLFYKSQQNISIALELFKFPPSLSLSFFIFYQGSLQFLIVSTRSSTLMSTKLPRKQCRSKRQKKTPEMSD